MIYCLLLSCPWFLEYFFFAKHVRTVRKLVHICSLHVTVMQILKTHFLNFSTIGLDSPKYATTGKQLTETQNFALFRKNRRAS